MIFFAQNFRSQFVWYFGDYFSQFLISFPVWYACHEIFSFWIRCVIVFFFHHGIVNVSHGFCYSSFWFSLLLVYNHLVCCVLFQVISTIFLTVCKLCFSSSSSSSSSSPFFPINYLNVCKLKWKVRDGAHGTIVIHRQLQHAQIEVVAPRIV